VIENGIKVLDITPKRKKKHRQEMSPGIKYKEKF